MGVVSKLLGFSQGDIAITAAIFFGIIFAFLGVIGILSRYF